MINNWELPSLPESKGSVRRGSCLPTPFPHERWLGEIRSGERLDLLLGVVLVLVVPVHLLGILLLRGILLLQGVLLLPRVLLLQGARGTSSLPCQVLWRFVLLSWVLLR